MRVALPPFPNTHGKGARVGPTAAVERAHSYRARSGSKGPIRATFQLSTFCEHRGSTRLPSPPFVTRGSYPFSCLPLSDMASCQISEKVDGEPLGIRRQPAHLSRALSGEPHRPLLNAR